MYTFVITFHHTDKRNSASVETAVTCEARDWAEAIQTAATSFGGGAVPNRVFVELLNVHKEEQS